MKDNKIIAEFMGWDIKSPTSMPRNLHLSNLELDNGEVWAYKFHTSWDWLMPVVEKCLDVSNDDNIEDFYSIQNVVPNIEATYQAVVEYIKECNESNKMDTLPPSVQQE